MARKVTPKLEETKPIKKEVLSKRERFLKYAPARTQNVIHQIEVLSNCADNNNYEYTTEEVEKIFSAINESLEIAKMKFISNKKTNKSKFKF